jgi:hypothetical protein
MVATSQNPSKMVTPLPHRRPRTQFIHTGDPEGQPSQWRQLQRFLPREGTELAQAQKEVEKMCKEEGETWEKTELSMIEKERECEQAEEYQHKSEQEERIEEEAS